MRQQAVDVLGFGGWKPRNHIAQVGIGIEPVDRGGLDQAVEHSCRLPTTFTRHEEIIVPALGHWTDGTFYQVVVYVQSPVVAYSSPDAPGTKPASSFRSHANV